MRAILGILAGIVAGLAAQTGVDMVNNLIYPAAISDIFDLEQVERAMEARPAAAFGIGVLSYFIGGLVGGLVGKLIWRHKAAAWTPAAVLAAMATIIAFNLPMPSWAMFGSLVAPLLGGLIANHLIASRPQEATTGAPPADEA